jgi:hypothetical protein
VCRLIFLSLDGYNCCQSKNVFTLGDFGVGMDCFFSMSCLSNWRRIHDKSKSLSIKEDDQSIPIYKETASIVPLRKAYNLEAFLETIGYDGITVGNFIIIFGIFRQSKREEISILSSQTTCQSTRGTFPCG